MRKKMPNETSLVLLWTMVSILLIGAGLLGAGLGAMASG